MPQANDSLPQKVLRTFYRRLDCYHKIFESPPEPAPPRAGLEVRELQWPRDRTDLLIHRQDLAEPRLAQRFAAGRRCFGVWREGALAHTAWLATSGHAPVPHIWRHLVIPRAYVYVFDSYSLPAYRRQGLSSARSPVQEWQLAREGYRGYIGLVAVQNIAGAAVPASRGFTKIGRYSSIGIWPFNHVHTTSAGGESLPALMRDFQIRRTP